MILKKLKKKTVLITGASSGLGREFARLLSQVEITLILVARRKERLEELKSDIEREGIVKVYVIVMDLATLDGPKLCFARVNELKLSVDVLINNAGFGLSDEFLDIPLQMYLDLVDINNKALLQMCYLFLPGMVNKRNGYILNVSSVLGAMPIPNMAVYGASKSFVLSFSESLWKEYRKKGIKVTCLVSVGIETEFFNLVKKRKFRFLPIQKPALVARKAINGLIKQKRIAYTGFFYSLLIHLKRILPQRVVIWIMGSSYKSNH